MYRSALGEFESEQAEQFYLETLRRMTPDQKLEAAMALQEMAIETMRAGVASDHPDWTSVEVQAEVARRLMETNGAARILAARAGGTGAS